MIYFNIDAEGITENCKFKFYYKTDNTPTVLDGGNEIILADWPNDKHIICNINNDIPMKILSQPYVLVNRSVLCSCGIEVEITFFLNIWLHVIIQIQSLQCTLQLIQLSVVI